MRLVSEKQTLFHFYFNLQTKQIATKSEVSPTETPLILRRKR